MKKFTNKGVFSDLLGRESDPNPMHEFIQGAKFLDESVPYVRILQEKYDDLQCELTRCALLEELVLLYRAKAAPLEPKFSLVSSRYIYARIPLFRRDSTLNEIRLLVETLPINKSYAVYVHDKDLMIRAQRLLAKEIEIRIAKKTAEYHANYGPITMQIA
ncbi:MAG: hypothetical protein RL638_1420 [Bacteroidota bacterium]|jgi:hypothetical protein